MKSNFYKILYLRKFSAGFTLVELLVAMAITTIIASVTGVGVVAITEKNKKEKPETERRVELNRAQDFITDEVRMATNVNDNSSVPEWAMNSDNADPSNSSSDWIKNLGGGSPSANLFLQIPLNVETLNASNEQFTVRKHGFSAGNAVMFTGTGIAAAGLSPNVVYYVTETPTTDTFKVSTSLSNAKSGTVVDLSAVSPGSLTANRQLIYYIRDNTSTWLGPKTINRSAGPCSSDYAESNCPVLIDSIAGNGFTARAISSRKAELDLRGTLSDNSPKTLQVTNNAFARLFKITGGADKAADEADKAAREAKEKAAREAAEEAAKKEAADNTAHTQATAAQVAADNAAKAYADAKQQAADKATAAQVAAAKAAVDRTAKAYDDAAQAAAAHAAAERDAAAQAAAAQAAAEKAKAAHATAAQAAAAHAAAERAAAKAAAELDTEHAAEHTAAAHAADRRAAEHTAAVAQGAVDYAAAAAAHTAAVQAANLRFAEAQAALERVIITVTGNEELWPPNNNMVDIAVNVQPGYEVTNLVITNSESQEPTKNENCGVQGGFDNQYLASRQIRLCRNRTGTGTGRLYTLTFSVRGRITPIRIYLCVPHSQGKGQGCQQYVR